MNLPRRGGARITGRELVSSAQTSRRGARCRLCIRWGSWGSTGRAVVRQRVILQASAEVTPGAHGGPVETEAIARMLACTIVVCNIAGSSQAYGEGEERIEMVLHRDHFYGLSFPSMHRCARRVRQWASEERRQPENWEGVYESFYPEAITARARSLEEVKTWASDARPGCTVLDPRHDGTRLYGSTV